ncbi:helix-turn-helix domain-containing protein [Acidaminococcus fermentans]|uniref:helix-turn-helix domain-containing protein n=1 Tax=Acidaminococcus fermentans TaxID=905 RepID=UPI002432DACD|nr:helix-turn-helix domain-containing protein [Acidaminococcus fermentans]
MMEQFNSKTLFDNIEFLIKSENRKIGEVESAAGVSAGYISRTSKDGGSKPGIDFIMNIAKALHVSIDTLLTVDIASMTPTERYLVSFLEKLEQDTAHDLLAWNRETKEKLNDLDFDRNEYVDHPLFSVHFFPEDRGGPYPEQIPRAVFISNAFDVNTLINGDCFNLRMKNGAQLYLMNISDAEKHSNASEANAIEVWMDIAGEQPQFLCSDHGNSKLKDLIENLYASIVESTKHPKVKKDVRYIIDSFMKNDNEDDPQDDNENTSGINLDDPIPF